MERKKKISSDTNTRLVDKVDEEEIFREGRKESREERLASKDRETRAT